MGHITFKMAHYMLQTKTKLTKVIIFISSDERNGKYAEYVPKQIASDELVDLEL